MSEHKSDSKSPLVRWLTALVIVGAVVLFCVVMVNRANEQARQRVDNIDNAPTDYLLMIHCDNVHYYQTHLTECMSLITNAMENSP